MAVGKLKKASESKVAAQVRKVIGAGPDEHVEVRTPQFERPAGEPGPMAAPSDESGFGALRAMSAQALRERGLRPWGRPESEDHARAAAAAGRRGPRIANLAGDPLLWLFPGEWYAHIPDGLEIVDINFRVKKFKRGEASDGIRFGCLAYGVLVRDAS